MDLRAMTDILARRLVPSKQAMESRVGEETVILQLESGTYYGLDPLGTDVWELLKRGMEPAAISDIVAREYGASREVVKADLRRFLSDLYAHAIVVDGSSAPPGA
jgi:hypothetical protein